MLYRYDFRYTLAKIPVNTVLRLNFRKLVFVGKKENVSKKRAIIFAPNHRNALIDALLLVYASYHLKQVVFLARADIFKKKFLAWSLRGLRIMPVFRIRDGKDNLERNNEIFENAARILKKNNPIALFPEARHNPKQSLLPIQKAVPRIVLPTEASVGFQLHSQIIPVAIYYRDIAEILSDVYVTFGSPIEVSDYEEIYKENPAMAINKLRQEMEDRLSGMVVNIRNDGYYNEYRLSIDCNADLIARKKYKNRKDAYLQASLYIVDKLDRMFRDERGAFDKKIGQFEEARTILEQNGLTSKDRLWKVSSVGNILARYIGLVLSFPIALFGYLNGLFPILINKKLLSLFKDKQFISSVKYVSGLIFVPIFDIIQSLIIGFTANNWTLALSYFFLMPATFYFALYWRKWLKTARRDQKVRRFASKHPSEWDRLQTFISI